MRTTIDLPDSIMKKVKLQAIREGVTLKEWFVALLRRDLDKHAADKPGDEAARFRERFNGTFEPTDIDSFKRSGRA